MPWVTFGCAGTAGMAVTVGANMKDENYFAKAAAGTTGTRAAEGNRGANREKRRRARLSSRLLVNRQGSRLPLDARGGRGSGYCFLPVKVPSPNCPSDTLPLIDLPSVLPEYFTARV